MEEFLGENFLLRSETAKYLFHQHAAAVPVIDYHCHLDPKRIADNAGFENITQLWLSGDHYKWRAMRANGVDESFCTGNKTDFEKFKKWAETIPYCLRNPLYHWTHLELQRYFNIDGVLNPESAKKIYDECNIKLSTPEFYVRNLLKKMNVQVICTTDDPVDSLEHHKKISDDKFEIKVFPSFRPDKAMSVDDATVFNNYVDKLEATANASIINYEDYLGALKSRHDFFSTAGCTVSDHGLECVYAEEYTEQEINNVFTKIRSGKDLDLEEKLKVKSALLFDLATWDHEKGWVQQFHLGAMRNNNSRMMHLLGPDTGWDSIGDFPQAKSLAKFLDKLDSNNNLAKTIIYNLNPADNEIMASMIGNFNDGSTAGKIQWGSAWWFLDQKEGMMKQLNTLSNMGLLSRFIGMITDSRSFMSYPRHEYFRRIICNLFGDEIEKGELPSDLDWTGKIIKDICYFNAKNYFGW